MCEFDIVPGMDWLTEHHATIDCRSYRVIFSDIHAPEFIYHGSLLGKSMQIISALQARTLLSHGFEGFLATIHDTTSEVPSIHDQPIISEFPDVFEGAMHFSKIDLRSAVFMNLMNRIFHEFLDKLCTKVLDPSELDKMKYQLVRTLCELEQIFPFSFFTVIVHLTMHLIYEAKLGGPVHYRWMYPVERYLMKLKSYVRNKAQPEGSIAEGYIKEECLNFCSGYFKGAETPFNRPPRNDENVVGKEMYMFNSSGRKLGKVEILELDGKSLAQAHRYVLLNHSKIQPFCE
nr:hypothetical protein [Tanacetum cinerariifolium]